MTTLAPIQRQPLLLGSGLGLAGLLLTGSVRGGETASLFLIALLMGLCLYHASFGFTAAWRRLVNEKRSAGLRAQMILFAIAVLLFFPVLAERQIFGQNVYGFVNPAGTSVLVGAFVFGIGMQLGGGCASGTLFTVGGGSTRMVLTLLFFVIGSVIGTAHMPFWLDLPSLGRISFIREWGLLPALGANLAVFSVIFLIASRIERRAHGELQPITSISASGGMRQDLLTRLTRGPWPLIWGAVGLALLNFATLVIKGSPWGITSGFALWGAKLFTVAGIDVGGWEYWSNQTARIARPLVYDTTSVMNIGIVIGAFLASALAGKFAPKLSLTRGEIVSAVVGGLMLGYGARLAFGCNIGALFSGIASGSLHGWLWLVSGFIGSIIGTRIRPLFGLP